MTKLFDTVDSGIGDTDELGGMDDVGRFDFDPTDGFAAELNREQQQARDGFSGGGRGARDSRVTPDRTRFFELGTGQFRDPGTGEFEPGGAPPDYDGDANRYRAEDGQFKSRTSDHYDEPAEVRLNSLEPEG